MTEPTNDGQTEQSHHKGLWFLVLGALGVVFGDIGTSPLYAVNEIFFGEMSGTFTRVDVLGAISLIFWALTLVIAIKYVFIVMRADNEGEGGVFALFAQLQNLSKTPGFLLFLLLFGSGLLYGDGIITPAISVVSAVEGLKVITPALEKFVVPITVLILTLLFSIQKHGTHMVGNIFGPIMVLWFLTLGFFGFQNIVQSPDIFSAVSPYYAYHFFTHHSLLTILITLGSVMLTITGGEAMFADMGHFGRLPIRIGWYILAYPALVLNYLGQGAYLLSEKTVLSGNVFYSMMPSSLLPIMVILATFATIIASQAMISGAFSLTTQAISLRLMPYLPIKHTHEDHEGQVYIGSINWALYAGSVLLVLIFQSSSRLAGAYGLAVAGDMFITTLSVITLSLLVWKWKPIVAFSLFLPFLFIDALFLTSNSLKIFKGGWIPLTIGVCIFSVIEIWKWGRKHTINTFRKNKTMTVKELIDLQRSTPNDLPRTMIFLTRTPITEETDNIPIQLQRYWDRNAGLTEHIVLLNVELLKVPHAKKRTLIRQFTAPDEPTGTITSITAYFGFMEDPDLEPLVRHFIRHKDIPSEHPPEQWVFKVLHERLLVTKARDSWTKFRFTIYNLLHRNTLKADEYFGLGDDHMLTIDICPVELS